jgi:hypothetical protein
MALRRALFLVAVLVACHGAAQAQQRIPATAKRGYLQHAGQMLVTIDGKKAQLAPGAMIRDQSNRIVMPTALPREGSWVRYVADANGQISQVWLFPNKDAAAGGAR